MGKLKNQIEKDQEKETEYYSKFMDFIYDHIVISKLSDDDINKIEESFKKPSTASNLILSKKALNNQNFNPLIVA